MREVQMENVHPLRLRLLLEIERTGSISAAAETCAIGQPSASMHLRTLETAIGQRLVTRTGRGSSLTAAGKVVASHAVGVLTTLDSMRRALDALDARHGGELILAASLTPSVTLIPRVLRRFSDRYPGVSVRLRTVPSETVLREVARAEADIGIAGEVQTAEPVIRTELLMDELIGIAPPGLLTLDRGRVSLGELARNSLMVGPEASSTRIVSERYLASVEYRPARVWVFDSYEAIKRAVVGGLGVSFISRLLVREEIERGELIAFRVSGVEPMVRRIQVVQPAFRDLTREGTAFMTILADAASEAASVIGPFTQEGAVS
jgi:molybdate transport repressor ModE-like protein